MVVHSMFSRWLSKPLLLFLIWGIATSCKPPSGNEENDPVINIIIVGQNNQPSSTTPQSGNENTTQEPIEQLFTVTADEPVSNGCTCGGLPESLTVQIHAIGGKPPYTLVGYPDTLGDSFTIPIGKSTGSITLTVQSSDNLQSEVTINIPSCSPPPDCSAHPNEKCNNSIDDDLDGKVDEGCPTPIEICGNKIDDDGDGQVDEGCPTPIEICGNKIDDDGDGQVDEGCPTPIEICGNNIDDDGDGQVDEDCVEICGNNQDDNRNGSIDEGCPEVACTNGADDDRDGKIDSADPDCPPDPPKKFQCDDGKDNDADGLIDLADPQCQNKPDDSESQ